MTGRAVPLTEGADWYLTDGLSHTEKESAVELALHIVAGVMVGAGMIQLVLIQKRNSEWSTVRATVTDAARELDRSTGKTMHVAHYKYEDAAGDEHSGTLVRTTAVPQEGASVLVRYNPENPSEHHAGGRPLRAIDWAVLAFTPIGLVLWNIAGQM